MRLLTNCSREFRGKPGAPDESVRLSNLGNLGGRQVVAVRFTDDHLGWARLEEVWWWVDWRNAPAVSLWQNWGLTPKWIYKIKVWQGRLVGSLGWKAGSYWPPIRPSSSIPNLLQHDINGLSPPLMSTVQHISILRLKCNWYYSLQQVLIWECGELFFHLNEHILVSGGKYPECDRGPASSSGLPLLTMGRGNTVLIRAPLPVPKGGWSFNFLKWGQRKLLGLLAGGDVSEETQFLPQLPVIV